MLPKNPHAVLGGLRLHAAWPSLQVQGCQPAPPARAHSSARGNGPGKRIATQIRPVPMRPADQPNIACTLDARRSLCQALLRSGKVCDAWCSLGSRLTRDSRTCSRPRACRAILSCVPGEWLVATRTRGCHLRVSKGYRTSPVSFRVRSSPAWARRGGPRRFFWYSSP